MNTKLGYIFCFLFPIDFYAFQAKATAGKAKSSSLKAYYHTIDISTKTVISKNNSLDNTASPGYTYGDHLTLLEDTYTNTGMLYATQYSSGTLNVVAFTITTKQTQQVPTVMTSFPAVNNGYSELQISPDGKKLVVYNHLLKTGWFDHQESELRTFNLGADFKITSNPVTTVYPVVSLPNGTKSGMSVDFTTNNRYIYYTRDLLVELNSSTGGEQTTWRYDYRDNDTNLVKVGLMGDVRRGDNGDINIAGNNLRTLDNYSQDPEGVYTLNTPTATITDSLTGALPIQSHKIYQDEPVPLTTFSRALTLKQYEITDHLGNVVLTVSDRKWVGIAGTTLSDSANVLSYSSYYPFGMRQVGRNKDLHTTAYGFNGKRYDSEVDGNDDVYDYGERMYDARGIIFLSVDPIAHQYPELTPYQFASLSPIQAIDRDGLESCHYTLVENEGETKLTPTSTIYDISNLWGLDESHHVNYNGEEYSFGSREEVDKFVKDKNRSTNYYSHSSKHFGELLAINFVVADLLSTPTSDEVHTDWTPPSTTPPSPSNIVKNSRPTVPVKANVSKPVVKPNNRPTFRSGVVDKTWNHASKQHPQGKVFDPTGKEIIWDKSKPRGSQWHMGHLPGKEYRLTYKKYVNGDITWKQLLNEYNNPNNYRPELPSTNFSHKFEQKK